MQVEQRRQNQPIALENVTDVERGDQPGKRRHGEHDVAKVETVAEAGDRAAKKAQERSYRTMTRAVTRVRFHLEACLQARELQQQEADDEQQRDQVFNHSRVLLSRFRLILFPQSISACAVKKEFVSARAGSEREERGMTLIC